MKNLYEINSDFVKIFCTNIHKEQFEILIDLEDLEKVSKHSWCIAKKRKRCYGICTFQNKRYYIHQIIIPYDSNTLTCDHIDMNGLNNKKDNLRICTNQQNNWNKPLKVTNKSGVTGVHFNKQSGLWIVQMTLKGKTKHLGSSKDFNEAVEIRRNAEQEFRGKFAPL